jgi:DNA-binding protein YbaB
LAPPSCLPLAGDGGFAMQIAELETRLQQLQDGYQSLRAELAQLRVSVTSADGLVTASVDARGQVERIDLDPRIYQRPDSRLLAATITATIRQAATEAMERVLGLTRPYLPDEVLTAHLELDLDGAFAHTAEMFGR